jgi:hypothetical protein
MVMVMNTLNRYPSFIFNLTSYCSWWFSDLAVIYNVYSFHPWQQCAPSEKIFPVRLPESLELYVRETYDILMCVCVCVCARACACVRVRVRVCVCVGGLKFIYAAVLMFVQLSWNRFMQLSSEDLLRYTQQMFTLVGKVAVKLPGTSEI